MIQSGPAPVGAAFLALDTSGMVPIQISAGAGLTSADLFEVWGSLGTTAAGGETNLVRLGTLRGSSGERPPYPWMLADWATVIVRRISGAGAGPIDIQGEAWARPAPLPALLPPPGSYSAPIDATTLGSLYAVALDDDATAGDTVAIYGTNDPTPRVPPSADGATWIGDLRGAGGAPVLVQGYAYLIAEVLTFAAAAGLVATEQTSDIGIGGPPGPPGPPGPTAPAGANSIAYGNPLGTDNTSDPLLTAAPLDQFARPQIRDIRQAAGLGAAWRQGAWQTDGDATNQAGEGVVIYGANGLGIGPSALGGGYARIKPRRIGLAQIIPGVNGGNLFHAFRADMDSVQGIELRDDLAARTLKVDRLTGHIYLREGATGMQGIVAIGAGPTPIANTTATANTRVSLTWQGGPPAGQLYLVGVTPGVGFSIASTSPADAGILVLWQMWEPA